MNIQKNISWKFQRIFHEYSNHIYEYSNGNHEYSNIYEYLKEYKFFKLKYIIQMNIFISHENNLLLYTAFVIYKIKT